MENFIFCAVMYYSLGKYKLSIRSFLEYCDTLVCVQDIFVLLERMFGFWNKLAQNLYCLEFNNNLHQAFHL